jgi:hypothetical protein
MLNFRLVKWKYIGGIGWQSRVRGLRIERFYEDSALSSLLYAWKSRSAFNRPAFVGGDAYSPCMGRSQ